MPKTAEVERDFTVYATRTPTAMQVGFAEWLKEETGYNPSAAKSKEEAFLMAVALSAYLRPVYQGSEANRARRAAARAEAEPVEEKPTKAKATKAKAAPAPAPAPAKAKAAKTATAKPAGKTGPRPAKRAASADASDSPF